MHRISAFIKKIVLLLVLSFGILQQANASHVVGADLYYTWVSGLTYKITVVLYGDCGPASAGAFASLPSGSPAVCVMNGTTTIGTINLRIENPTAGVEITPVCATDRARTQCTSTSYTIPGIKKFVYSLNYTLPYESASWRFIFKGNYGGSSAGRAAAITNITAGTTLELMATLNNIARTNSNPILTVVPTPFFCLNGNCNYNPGAVDPEGDSLSFALVPGKVGGSTTCAIGGAVTYTTGVLAWTPSTFISATTPLRVSAGSFSFDTRTGQISFIPNFAQRALVVYTVGEYRGDSLIGTSQREMTFLVITCTSPTPTGGITGSAGGTVDDSTHYHICAGNDSFSLYIRGSAADTTKNIKITHTGLPGAASIIITNDSTPHPVATIRWTSTGVTPGNYTFYLTFTDDNCPLSGQQTLAFTMSILPVPTLTTTLITPASCLSRAVVAINPGGQGNPWRIDHLNAAGGLISTRSGVTGTYNDTFNVGMDSLVIYSSLSTFCNMRYGVPITMPTFPTPTATFSNPTFCGQNDGRLTLTGLNPNELDSIHYSLNGVVQPTIVTLIPTSGVLTLNSLCAGRYDNIYVTYGNCRSGTLGPIVLRNPNFTMNRVELISNASECGRCDGVIKLHGLHPYQTDSIFFTRNGIPQAPVVAYVYADSSITIYNLCSGRYDNFVARTVGECPGNPNSCISNRLGPVTVSAPTISSAFDTLIKLGCRTDTVIFTNRSSPTTGLSYRWYFGDGFTDTNMNTRHVYFPWGDTTYTIKLFITNADCLDSTIKTVSFIRIADAAFTVLNDTICQGDDPQVTNISTGRNVRYAWDFGDGVTSSAVNPTHIYPKVGSYTIRLSATDDIPCTDVATKIITVDSNTSFKLTASDTVFCKGGAVTFEGLYSTSGLTGITWDFGDGTGQANINPVQHSYDISGNVRVTLSAQFRKCPAKTITKDLRIYEYPRINLGPDTAICPGSGALAIIDNYNAGNIAASWIWNTGDFTSGITVSKPGTYIATVSIHGCASTDSLIVSNDCYLSLPNVFTPNNDGVNDFFFPRDVLAKGLTSFSMTIYNRWGQEVYKSKANETSGWGGKFNDSPQPQGVYLYIIDANFKDGQKMHKEGNVTLLR